MTASIASSQRADRVYLAGPEKSVAESSIIVAGPIADYGRRVLEQSSPGPDGVPLKWITSGRIDRPQTLKGRTTGPQRFSRSEQVGFLPGGPSGPEWVLGYGELGPADQVILFFTSEKTDQPVLVLPSGTGERDSLTLIRDIVATQALPDLASRERAWISYLQSSPSDEGKKTALRSLLAEPVDWGTIAEPVERLLRNSAVRADMRAFAFGAAAFGVTHDLWKSRQLQAVDLLSRIFESETNPRQALDYILHLKLVLAWANEEAARNSREPLRRRVLEALSRRAQAIPPDADLQQQYQQIRAAYPGAF